MFEYRRRPTLMLGKLINTQNSGVHYPIQKLELSLRGISPLRPGHVGRLKRNWINSDAPLRLCKENGLN